MKIKRFDNINENLTSDIIEHAEIHPKILKKYRDKILLNVTTNKYNI